MEPESRIPRSGTASGYVNPGNGDNRYRAETWAHPRALQPGDRLADGSVVADFPREAGNGGIEVPLAARLTTHRIVVPARLPIALENAP